MMQKPHLRINTALPSPNDLNETIKIGRRINDPNNSPSKSKNKKTSKHFSVMMLLCFFLLMIIFVIFIECTVNDFESLKLSADDDHGISLSRSSSESKINKFETMTLTVDDDYDNNAISLSRSSSDGNILQSLTLPKKLDLKTVEYNIQNLKDIIVLGKNESSPLQNCEPTVQIKIYQMVINGSASWFIQTFDQDGHEKIVGGDEFYIDYTDMHPKHKHINTVNDHIEPDAVALIHDFKNGTYQLDFVSTPMSARTKNKSIPQQEGRIKVHFEYTCGIGMLPQPTKKSWKASGAMYLSPVYRDFFPRPPIRIFEPPKTPTLSSYSLVIFFGDSTMYQLAVKDLDDNEQKIFFRPNITYMRNVRSELTKDRLKKFFLRKLSIFHGKQLRELDNVALVIGSSIWDLLIEDNIQGTSFGDHIEAVRDFINKVKDRYPKVSLYWKGTSALHPHRVDCNEANYDYQDCLNSTKYLSNSRVQTLEVKQRHLMKELQVPYLDLYPAYYLSAHYMAPGDGRHSVPMLNEEILNWFFSRQLFQHIM